MIALTDKDPMPYGQHKGKPLEDVPDSYLLYVWENHDLDVAYRQLKLYLTENIEAIKSNVQCKK